MIREKKKKFRQIGLSRHIKCFNFLIYYSKSHDHAWSYIKVHYLICVENYLKKWKQQRNLSVNEIIQWICKACKVYFFFSFWNKKKYLKFYSHIFGFWFVVKFVLFTIFYYILVNIKTDKNKILFERNDFRTLKPVQNLDEVFVFSSCVICIQKVIVVELVHFIWAWCLVNVNNIPL